MSEDLKQRLMTITELDIAIAELESGLYQLKETVKKLREAAKAELASIEKKEETRR